VEGLCPVSEATVYIVVNEKVVIIIIIIIILGLLLTDYLMNN
jgi:hypothetical protein